MHTMSEHQVLELCAISTLCHITGSEGPILGGSQEEIKKLLQGFWIKLTALGRIVKEFFKQ